MGTATDRRRDTHRQDQAERRGLQRPWPPRRSRGGHGSSGVPGVAPRATAGQLLCSHFTLKLVPLLSDDTETLARPLEFTMMILVGLALPSFEPSTLELLK